jgi:hypothetical protein
LSFVVAVRSSNSSWGMTFVTPFTNLFWNKR